MIDTSLIPPIFGILGLIVAFIIFGLVMRYDEGDEKIKKIADAIHTGAMVFMRREYSMLALFGGILLVILYLALGTNTAIAYIVGAILVVTWRSGPLRRRQLGVVLPALVLYVVLGSLTGTVPEWVSMASMLLFPASIVVAITRYRLYELDRIVSRTVTYVVVVGLLVATYFGLVLVLRSLLPVEGLSLIHI